MRSKHFLPFLMAMALSLVLVASAFSGPPKNQQALQWAKRSPVGHVYLLPQKVGNHHRMPHFFSWGTLRYNKWGQRFEFAFNGFNLERSQEYTLIYYPGEEASMICLGQGRSNRGGHINITGNADICSLPATEDANYPYGARIMLVPSEDVACEEGVLFVPESSQNLLSQELIRFTDTDGCPVLEPPATTPTPTPAPTPAPAEEEVGSADEGGETSEPGAGETTTPEDGSGQSDLPYGGLPY